MVLTKDLRCSYMTQHHHPVQQWTYAKCHGHPVRNIELHNIRMNCEWYLGPQGR